MGQEEPQAGFPNRNQRLWMIYCQTAIALELIGGLVNCISWFGLRSRKRKNDGW
jgi:hypothetical protein